MSEQDDNYEDPPYLPRLEALNDPRASEGGIYPLFGQDTGWGAQATDNTPLTTENVRYEPEPLPPITWPHPHTTSSQMTVLRPPREPSWGEIYPKSWTSCFNSLPLPVFNLGVFTSAAALILVDVRLQGNDIVTLFALFILVAFAPLYILAQAGQTRGLFLLPAAAIIFIELTVFFGLVIERRLHIALLLVSVMVIIVSLTIPLFVRAIKVVRRNN